MKTTILVFGLDGATWKLLNPWLKAGRLPFLQNLIKNGSAATLQSVLPPLTSTAWTTFQTGVNPVKHDIFGFRHPHGKLYNSDDIRQPKFWEIAAAHGKESAVINMPLTYPIHPFNGWLVSSFLTPPKANFAYPLHLQRKLIKLHYQIDLSSNRQGFAPEKHLGKRSQQRLHEEIAALVASREKAALHIIKQKRWDIFFVLFKATDLSQHFFWDQKETLKTYQQIDQAMAKISAAHQATHPKAKTNILVISDHGFHPISKYDICLYQLISRLGFLPRRPNWYLKMLRAGRKICKSEIIANFAYPSAPKIFSYGLYWPAATPKTIRDLAAKLTKFTYKGKKVFQEIRIVNSAYSSRLRLLWITNPYFAPNPDPLSGQLVYRKITSLKAHHYSDMKGIFIAAGPNIKRHPKKLQLDLVDIPGNILRILGISPLPDMDSQLRPHLFIFPRQLAPKLQTLSRNNNQTALEKENSDVVIQRLRNLGYVD